MQTRKKVFFLIPTLSGGGAERVIVNLLQHIDRTKICPHLVLFYKKGEYLINLSADITIHELKKNEYKYGFQWLILFKLKMLIKNERPDIIISFMWYPNFLNIFAKYLSGIDYRIVVSERLTVSVSCEGRLTELLRRVIIRFFYNRADSIIVNANAMGVQLRQMFSIPLDKIKVIHNPINIQKIILLSKEDVHNPWYKENVPIIIGVGRLSSQKGFSYLIKAIHIIDREGIQCRLLILGKGKEDKKLKKLVKDLCIDDKVIFLGFQENPYKYLAKSTLFVLSSLYEGLPNALLEALSLGVPSIATRCPTGPEEIITDGVDGILVPPADEKALANAIKKLLLVKNLRKRLSEAARKRAEDFRVEKIIKQYENVIDNVCAASAEN
jgi:glycosyltransferase involved in cell wall biosynthesis